MSLIDRIGLPRGRTGQFIVDGVADGYEAFALAAYVEENAYRQYMAMQIGEPYVFSEAEQQACREKLWTRSLFQKTWDHYRSKIS